MLKSPRRAAVLAYLNFFRADRGYAPSMTEIAAACCISKSNVLYHLKALQAAGLIHRQPRTDRTIVILDQ